MLFRSSRLCPTCRRLLAADCPLLPEGIEAARHKPDGLFCALFRDPAAACSARYWVSGQIFAIRTFGPFDRVAAPERNSQCSCLILLGHAGRAGAGGFICSGEGQNAGAMLRPGKAPQRPVFAGRSRDVAWNGLASLDCRLTDWPFSCRPGRRPGSTWGICALSLC